jgi:hypothetical protein
MDGVILESSSSIDWLNQSMELSIEFTILNLALISIFRGSNLPLLNDPTSKSLRPRKKVVDHLWVLERSLRNPSISYSNWDYGVA